MGNHKQLRIHLELPPEVLATAKGRAQFAASESRRLLILQQALSGDRAGTLAAQALLRDDIDAVLALVDAAGDLALFVSRHTPAARAALTGAMRTLMQAIAPMDAEAARERMRASLAAAEAAGFDIFVICDKNLRYQQNLADRRLAILELWTNHRPTLERHFVLVGEAVTALKAGEYRVLSAP
jgi:hypothetical protein